MALVTQTRCGTLLVWHISQSYLLKRELYSWE